MNKGGWEGALLLPIQACGCHIPANSVAPSVYEPHTTNNCCICSDEEANARNVSLKTLYGGQFVSSTQFIKPNYLNCGELPVCNDGLN